MTPARGPGIAMARDAARDATSGESRGSEDGGAVPGGQSLRRAFHGVRGARGMTRRALLRARWKGTHEMPRTEIPLANEGRPGATARGERFGCTTGREARG